MNDDTPTPRHSEDRIDLADRPAGPGIPDAASGVHEPTGTNQRGGLTVYPFDGFWKWTVASPQGEVLADAAVWRTNRGEAERDIGVVLDTLLRTNSTATQLRIAHFLAGVDAATRRLIEDTADEIARSRSEPDIDLSS